MQRSEDRTDCQHYHACLIKACKVKRLKAGAIPGGASIVCQPECELYKPAPKEFKTLRSNLGWAVNNG